MRPPGDDGDGGGGGRPETGAVPHSRAGLGVPDLLPFFPGGGGQMRPPAGDGDGGGGGGGQPETVDAARAQAGPRVPDLPPFFPGGCGPIVEPPGGDGDGGFGGRESNDSVSFTQLDDETWMGRSLVSLIIGTQESANFANRVHSQSNRRFPDPFVPPAASAHSASSTTSQGASAASASSTTTQPSTTRTHAATTITPTATTRTSAPSQTCIPPLPHSPAPPRATWIPPRQTAPSHVPPHGQQTGAWYENTRTWGYFTAGLNAENQQEE